MGFPGGLVVKNSICQCGTRGIDPWSRQVPGRRKWQPAPLFLPGESHAQRSLVGYSPRGYKRVGHNWATITISRPLGPFYNILLHHSHTIFITIYLSPAKNMYFPRARLSPHQALSVFIIHVMECYWLNVCKENALIIFLLGGSPLVISSNQI